MLQLHGPHTTRFDMEATPGASTALMAIRQVCKDTDMSATDALTLQDTRSRSFESSRNGLQARCTMMMMMNIIMFAACTGC